MQDDGSVEVKFLFPVNLRTKKGEVVSNEVIDKLRLHRLVGADLRKIGESGGGNGMASTVAALSCSTRISLGRMSVIFDRMDSTDITRVGEVLQSMLAPRGGRRRGIADTFGIGGLG